MKLREKTMQAVFFLTACVSIVSVVLICLFLFANGIPAMGEIGALNFLLGKEWRPGNGMFGIFPMILGGGLHTPVAQVNKLSLKDATSR